MQISTEFDIGEEVWDLLTKKRVKVMGFTINRGNNCCYHTNNSIIYYVDNHLCGTFRKPEELMRVKNEETDGNYECSDDCDCRGC